MTPTLSNAERWRLNAPAARSTSLQTMDSLPWGDYEPHDRPQRPVWPFLVLGLFALLFLAGLACAQDLRPEVVVFTTQGCGPCEQLKRDFERGYLVPGYNYIFAELGQFPELEREYLERVPIQSGATSYPPKGTGYSGRLENDRWCFPTVWIRGTDHHFTGGYGPDGSDLARLQAYLKGFYPKRTQAVNWHSGPLPATRLEPEPDPRFTPSLADDFEGVVLIVAVGNMSDQAQPLRKALARRAEAVLEDLARSEIGEQVHAYLVTEVESPTKYNQLANAAGFRPTSDTLPIVCHVLIPARLRGVQGVIAKRAELALAGHFLPQLKEAGINVVIERIHGGTYEALLQAVDSDEPGGLPDREDPLWGLAAAWITERSQVARWVLGLFGIGKLPEADSDLDTDTQP